MLDYRWSHNRPTYQTTVTTNWNWTHTVPKFDLQSRWITGACHYMISLVLQLIGLIIVESTTFNTLYVIISFLLYVLISLYMFIVDHICNYQFCCDVYHKNYQTFLYIHWVDEPYFQLDDYKMNIIWLFFLSNIFNVKLVGYMFNIALVQKIDNWSLSFQL